MFACQGFEATTMESIAQAAQIHPATLYRYFPSKDLIVLAEFAAVTGRIGDHLESSPPEQALSLSLGSAIEAVLDAEDSVPVERRRVVRRILDESPGARARLWDLLEEQRTRIAEVIAARSAIAPGDPRAVLSARLTVLILETAADLWARGEEPARSSAIARDLMRLLEAGEVILPAATT